MKFKKRLRNLVNNLMKRRMVPGFTLIEMVVVIAIVAMLMVLIIPNVTKQKDNASSKTDQAFIQTIQTQVDLAEEKPKTLEGASKDIISENQQVRIKQNHLILDGDGNVVVSQ